MLAKSCELTYPFIFKFGYLVMPIKLIRSLEALPSAAKHSIVTLGNFDGMHLGHQQLLAHVVKTAKESNSKSVVITFNPHPAEYFSDKKQVSRLSSIREKIQMMETLGVDYLIILKFNHELANQSAHDFVFHILYEGLNAKHIVIGDDFRFGCKRQGDFVLLKELGVSYQFSVEAMPQYDFLGQRVSSTRVRGALKNGDLALTRQLLGRAYTVSGHVQYGDALGRRLGYPTINLAWTAAPPLTGIYTVLVHGIEAQPLKGVASSGMRPTVDGTYPLLEVHLLDFNRMIYGMRVSVEFCQKLREEERFSDLEALSAQIAIDVAKSKAYFTGKE